MNIESLTNLFKELWTLEIIVILIGITCRHEGLARIKPLRAGRFGPQFYSEKFTHLQVLLDMESNHVSLNVKFFITILSK